MEELKQPQPRQVWLFRDNPCNLALTREIAKYQGFQINSLMVMPLGVSDGKEIVWQGSLVLFNEGSEKFPSRLPKIPITTTVMMEPMVRSTIMT